LEKIGDWLKKNGKAIYNTVATPLYHDGDVWFTESKDGKKMYAIFMQKGDSNASTQTISWHGNLPKGGVRCLATGKKVKCKIDGDKVSLTLPDGIASQSVAFEYSK
jgi:alpha-L-fucosidase